MIRPKTEIDIKQIEINRYDRYDSGDQIVIVGASENNLKHINVTIPKCKLVAFAGISGSGKSSLAFDTLAVESAREWQSTYPLFLRNKLPHYERPRVDELHGLTPTIVVNQRAISATSRSNVGTAVDVAPLLRLLFSRIGIPSAGSALAYSFNHPAGMCPSCTGIGEEMVLDEDTLFDLDKSLAEGGILFSAFSSGWQMYLYQNCGFLNPDKKLRDYTSEEWEFLKYGPKEPIGKIELFYNTGTSEKVDYEGVIPRFYRLYFKRDITKLKKSVQDEIMSHITHGVCHVCGGSGLNSKALESKIMGYNIMDMMSMPVVELIPVLEKLNDPLGASLAQQIISYLQRMVNVGLGYLSLSRKTETLSGGESQRLKLVRNLGRCLNNITYIFDEPTAGLHPADAERIGGLLLDLRNNHNNVLIVEHNRQMLALADHIIELGPGAGANGGHVVFEGSPDEIKKAKTPTSRTLREKISINYAPLTWNEAYEIKDAHCHNLKNVNVKIPKRILTAITGVAGSGKSSLMCYEFPRQYPGAIVVNQKPIGTSIRSTAATYLGVMDEIYKLFAKQNGVDAGWFSFNSKGGCPVCKGRGEISYEMAFADPVKVTCEECGGLRYNPTALSYTYKGFNIKQIMDFTIEQAIQFFDSDKIRKRLQSMLDVGLGCLTLGQPTSTLSGGEVQRVKLASELHKTGSVYVLDEPSVGLHSNDIQILLSLLRKLVEKQNSVIIVEHRLELIAQADWIIDMGPEGGSSGGEIVFEGTPEMIIKCKESKTGRYLSQLM